MQIQKVKELIQQEFKSNKDKAVQVIYDQPRPKKVLPFYQISLADDPKIMALSKDSIFLGLPTGEVQVIKPMEPSNNFSWKVNDGAIEKILVAKDNTIVVTSSSAEIKVWELIDLQQYTEKASIEITEDEVNLMNLSEGGEFLAYTGKNKELRIVELSEEKNWPIQKILVSEEVQQLCFSFHGAMLAYTSQQENTIMVNVWNTESWEQGFRESFKIDQQECQNQENSYIKKIIFGEQNFLLIANAGTIYQLDKQFKGINKIQNVSELLDVVAFSNCFAIFMKNNIICIEFINNKSISQRFLLWNCKATPTTSMVGFLSKKAFICANQNNIQCYLLYDCKKFKEEFQNYKRVNTIKEFNSGVVANEIANLQGHQSQVNSVAFNYAGTIIASGSDDCTIKL